MSYEDFDVDRARELRQKATGGITKEARKSLLITLMSTLPFIAVIGFAAAKWATAGEPELRMFYLLLGLVGLLMHTGAWAVCGMDARILVLLKEIKQLRLDRLSAHDSPPERASGGAESLSVWAVAGLKPKVLFIAIIGVSLLAGGFALVTNEWAQRHPRTFGGQEVAEVRVDSDGMFRVHSRISITRCADNVASIPIRLPQPNAVIESVTIDGRKIPFEPRPGIHDAYTIMPGLPEEALKKAMLEVVWSPPPADITGEDGVRQFSLPMQGLIPTKAYAANVVIDEDAPYQLAYGDRFRGKSTNLFWTKRSSGEYLHEPLGTCGIAIKPIEGDQ